MRIMFGLVSLLVVFAIVMLLYSMSATSSIDAKKKAEQQIQPMTVNPGIIESPNTAAANTAATGKQLVLSGDSRGLVVDDIGPQNPVALHYPILKGDRIIQAGDTALRGEDEQMARTYFQLAYERQRDLILERGAAKMTLTFKK